MQIRRWMILLLVLLMSISLTSAQPGSGGPGGGDRPGGGAGSPGGGRNPQPVGTPVRAPDGLGNGGRMGAFGGLPIELPDNLPTSREEIIEMVTDGDLPIDWDLEDLGLDSGSETAYAAIVGFAQTYLGTSVNVIYAGEVEISDAEETVTSEEATADAIAQVSSELPDEVQAILAAAEGTIYWSILSNGAAVVYTGYECTDDCTIDMENLEVNVTSASLGAYLIYTDGTASSSNAAYNLIIATYPSLASYGLQAVDSDSGYVFSAYDYDMSGTDVSAIGAIAGVMSVGDDKSLVYVALGLGDGYVDLMR